MPGNGLSVNVLFRNIVALALPGLWQSGNRKNCSSWLRLGLLAGRCDGYVTNIHALWLCIHEGRRPRDVIGN